jgi:hypothetical protein
MMEVTEVTEVTEAIEVIEVTEAIVPNDFSCEFFMSIFSPCSQGGYPARLLESCQGE